MINSAHPYSQLQRHIHHAGQRIVVVRRDRHEAEIAVERACRTHRGERVEQHRAIALRAGVLDQLAGKLAPEARAPESRAQIEPLHFADARLDLAVRDRAGGICAVARDQHHAGRPRIFAGQTAELVVDVLEADVSASEATYSRNSASTITRSSGQRASEIRIGLIDDAA
jgi:hypothetical protein